MLLVFCFPLSREDRVSRAKTCCSLEDVEDARSVARHLGIPYYVFNFSRDFKAQVIERFVAAYESGATRTPVSTATAI